jgi:hypothetical protein
MVGLTRRRVCALIAACAVIAALTTGTTQAAAVGVDAQCIGTSTWTFTPGVTLTPQAVTLTARTTYSVCLSSNPAVVAGSETQTLIIAGLSCESLFRSGAGIGSITWNTAPVSNYTFSDSVVVTPETATITRLGTVTSGTFTGDTVTRIGQFLNNDVTAACTSPAGVTQLAGPTTLTIAGLL